MTLLQSEWRFLFDWRKISHFVVLSRRKEMFLMEKAKEQWIKEQERGIHLDCCMKCGKVLRTWPEREIMICDDCYKRSIEED
jgi:hypothetical protein